MTYSNQYNTQQEHIKLKEYGRNVQKIAEYITTVEDEVTKDRLSATLVQLMKQLNPTIKDNEDLVQRLWNHLFVISDMKLTLKDAPFPPPTMEDIYRAPDRVPYGQHRLRYKHYGQNVISLIGKAIELEDPKDKEGACIEICKLMKRFQMTWNRDVNVEDTLLIQHLEEMSNGKLTLDAAIVKEHNLFKISMSETPGASRSGGRDYSRKRQQNNNNRRRKGGRK